MGAEAYVHGVSPDHGKTDKDHFYPTPPEATKSLLAIETLGPKLWEPACGKGDMSRVLEAAGHEVISTDLVDRGYGTPRVDFLFERRLLAPEVVTNPPFKLAEDFFHHAWSLGADKICMLLRLAWLEGDGRKKRIYDVLPPARVHISSRRISMYREDADEDAGGGMIAFAWWVWERDFTGQYPELRFFDWLDHAPECWKGKKPPPVAVEPMPLFA